MQVIDIPVDTGNRESTHHGTQEFPMAVYCSVMNRNILGYTRLHWHEEIQFCLVVKGSILFYVNQECHLLQEGDGIFINSGYLHMAKPESLPDSTYICVDVNPRILSGFPGSVIERKYLLPSMIEDPLEHVVLRAEKSWQKEILREMAQIYALNEEKPFGYEVEIIAVVYQIWLAILRNRPQALDQRRKFQTNDTVQQILSYISQHYSETVTISDIARAVNFSASECCRMFKRVTGETIFSYLRAFRLEQGAFLLLTGNLSVSEIAYETGFSSTSYFIEAFKAQFNTTPLQYRKTNSR